MYNFFFLRFNLIFKNLTVNSILQIFLFKSLIYIKYYTKEKMKAQERAHNNNNACGIMDIPFVFFMINK